MAFRVLLATNMQMRRYADSETNARRFFLRRLRSAFSGRKLPLLYAAYPMLSMAVVPAPNFESLRNLRKSVANTDGRNLRSRRNQ